MLNILSKSIKFMKNNKLILNKFCSKNFNLFSITTNFHGITCANSDYIKKLCLLRNFLLDDYSKNNLYYVVDE